MAIELRDSWSIVQKRLVEPDIYPTNATNLAEIPDDWQLNDSAYVFVDYSVGYGGNPSLRLQPGGDIDPFGSKDRSAWTNNPYNIPVKPGDHIVATGWIKTDATGQSYGARIGVELKGSGYILTPPTGVYQSQFVPWGTPTWTQVTLDVYVPTTAFTQDQTGASIPPTYVNAIGMWIQALPGDAPGNAWSSNAQLYINP